MNYNYIMLICIYYCTISCYITTYIYLTTYLQFKGSNCKVKLVRSRMCQIEKFWRKACRRLMVEVVTPLKICFPMIYIFFEVMLKWSINGIRSCLEDYTLLFLFHVCFRFLHSYVRILLLWNFGFGNISLFNFIYSCLV